MERLKIAVDTEAGRLRTELQAALDRIRTLEQDSAIKAAAPMRAAGYRCRTHYHCFRTDRREDGVPCASSLIAIAMAIARLLVARRKGIEVIARKKTVAKYSRTRLRIDIVIFCFAGALTIAAAWSQPISWLILIICLACSLVFAKVIFSRTMTRPTDGTLAAVSFAMSDWVVLAWVGAAALSGFLAASEFGISLGEAMGRAVEYIDAGFRFAPLLRLAISYPSARRLAR